MARRGAAAVELTPASVGTVLTMGAQQLATATIDVLGVIALAVLCLVLLCIAIGVTLTVRARWADRRRPRTPSQPVQVVPYPPPGVAAFDALALVCGVCNHVPGAWRCACSGNCGSQACQGAAVYADLSGEAQRALREDRRGR